MGFMMLSILLLWTAYRGFIRFHLVSIVSSALPSPRRGLIGYLKRLGFGLRNPSTDFQREIQTAAGVSTEESDCVY